jgi:REP-associated tyrosine transposase
LHHAVPHWVGPGTLFHIRIALDREHEQRRLTDPILAQTLLDSAKLYETKQRWHITLLVLMPDHLHALLSFARDESMSDIIGDWKRFHAHKHGVTWQEGYFDHRLRADERSEQLAAKMTYIRNNPVAAGLCGKAEDWRWIIDPFR